MLAVVILGGALAALIFIPWPCEVPPRAREAVLRTNLRTIRDVIAQYHGDKGRYPESLDALIAEGYLRKVPFDPFTRSYGTWRLTYENHPGTNGTRGIIDAHSGAGGKTVDGQPLAGL
ncbi:MAG TPA: type II secretion system protein G [Thermoanaerobaculia bacterium]|nr:type II secretion system protein G [Thermoanaerobaculia bacterium]